MSFIKRSEYQKVVEENKQLKKDQESLVMIDDMEETKSIFTKWREEFKKQREFKRMLKKHSEEYVNKHKNDKDFNEKFIKD